MSRAAPAQILDGPIARGVFSVAAPSVVTMLVHTANGYLDAFFVGGLGPDALAAVGVGLNLSFLLMSAAMAVSVGTSAIVAHSIGAADVKQARDATKQSLSLILLISLVVGALMFLVREPLVRFQGLDARTVPMASAYIAVVLLGLPAQFLMLTLAGAFRGLGDTVRPFWVTVGACGVHALFNWLLIFGNLGFPRLGIIGGAIALGLSQVAALVLYGLFLPKTALGSPGRDGWRLQREWVERIVRIGLPAAGQQLLRVGSMTLFQTLLGRFGAGTAAIAALSIGLRAESLAFMPGFGYSNAAAAFVGQNLGAGQPERARQAGWSSAWQAILVMSAMGAIFYIFAEPFVRLFVHKGDPALVAKTTELAIHYLKVAAVAQPCLALGIVLTGALQGAGETRGPSILTAISTLAVRLPLGWALLKVGGVPGAWWAMTLSTVLHGLATAYLFHRGEWRRRNL